MNLSLAVLKFFLVLLEFTEFLTTPIGLTASLLLFFWSTLMLLNGWSQLGL